MKIIEKSQKIIKAFEIDYENGMKCEFSTNNGKLMDYKFSNGLFNLTYVESVAELSNIHWSDHQKIIKSQKKLTITQIKNFEDFDKLFYVGGHMDGMTKNKDGVFISTPIILDYIFFQCYMSIEKKKEKCQEIIDSLNKDYIIESNIIEIPYYNQNDDKKHHFTLHLTVKLPDDVYNKFMNGKEHLDDQIKIEIFNSLKS